MKHIVLEVTKVEVGFAVEKQETSVFFDLTDGEPRMEFSRVLMAFGGEETTVYGTEADAARRALGWVLHERAVNLQNETDLLQEAGVRLNFDATAGVNLPNVEQATDNLSERDDLRRELVTTHDLGNSPTLWSLGYKANAALRGA